MRKRSRQTGRRVLAVSEELAVLQAEFPVYKIWLEQTPGRVRYVAQSRLYDVNPHTVITDDMAELRETLQPGPATGNACASTTGPNIARMYSYWLSQRITLRPTAPPLTGSWSSSPRSRPSL